MNPQSQQLNTDAILTAVRQGYVPDNWRVYHGRFRFQVQQVIGGLIILALGFAGTMYLLLNPDTAIVPGSAGSSDTFADSSTIMAGRVLDFSVLGIVLVVSLVATIIAFSRLPTIRDNLLVLMPDGFLLNTKKPAAYAYSTMQSLTARASGGTYTFTIVPFGGGRQTARIDARFGSPKQLATQILTARTEWQRAHSVPQPPQSFGSPQPPLPGASH